LASYYTYRLILKKGLSHDHAGLDGLLLLLALLLMMSISSPGNVFIPSIAVVIFGAKAVGLGFSTGRDNSPFSKILVALGKYSYSICLVHFLLLF
jgi:peptidoglycan/LPS O-acetylase OafA/YrhL